MSLKRHELSVIADLLEFASGDFCSKGCSDYLIESKAEKLVARDMGQAGEDILLGEDIADHLEKRVRRELKKAKT